MITKGRRASNWGEGKPKSRCVHFYPIENLEFPREKDNLNGSKSATGGSRWRAKCCIISPREVTKPSQGQHIAMLWFMMTHLSETSSQVSFFCIFSKSLRSSHKKNWRHQLLYHHWITSIKGSLKYQNETHGFGSGAQLTFPAPLIYYDY